MFGRHDSIKIHAYLPPANRCCRAAGALHTVAVKANPVGKVLQVFRDQGMGAEVRVGHNQ
jgi:diaminopimelate decarboxylase